MSTKELDRLLAEAQKAYQRRDKRKGARLLEKVLQQDFTHPEAWQLLYRLYGSGQSLEEFQLAFTRQYYPEKLPLLVAADRSRVDMTGRPEWQVSEAAGGEPAPATRRLFPTTWLSKLFSRRSSKPDPGQKAEQAAPGATAEQSATSGTTTATSMPSLQPEVPLRTTPLPPLPNAAIRNGPPERMLAQPPAPQARTISHTITTTPDRRKIQVLVVDDIAETRENVIRSLRFQDNVEVVGTASNGAKAIQLTKELKPDVVVMDVNMPDMDGITATAGIRREVPFTQIVILTVQDDIDYIRGAMAAGARDFLTKPPTIDELMAAIERAGAIAKDERTKTTILDGSLGAHFGKGKIITVYSPKGGSGCTMLASNLAAALYNQETPVALIDGNFQFGDLAVFFNVMGKNSLLDLTSRVEDLDPQLVEEVMIEHSSGIKLLAPPPMGAGDGITSVEFAKLLNYLSYLYPYVIVDASHWLTDTTLAAFDASDLVVLITTQDIPCIARARKFLDLAPLINLDRRSNILVVMNQYDKRIGISPEKIGEVLKLEVSAVLPLESGVVIPSINRGVPFMLQKDMLSRPIARSTLDMIEAIRQRIARLEQMAAANEQAA